MPATERVTWPGCLGPREIRRLAGQPPTDPDARDALTRLRFHLAACPTCYDGWLPLLERFPEPDEFCSELMHLPGAVLLARERPADEVYPGQTARALLTHAAGCDLCRSWRPTVEGWFPPAGSAARPGAGPPPPNLSGPALTIGLALALVGLGSLATSRTGAPTPALSPPAQAPARVPDPGEPPSRGQAGEPPREELPPLWLLSPPAPEVLDAVEERGRLLLDDWPAEEAPDERQALEQLLTWIEWIRYLEQLSRTAPERHEQLAALLRSLRPKGGRGLASVEPDPVAALRELVRYDAGLEAELTRLKESAEQNTKHLGKEGFPETLKRLLDAVKQPR